MINKANNSIEKFRNMLMRNRIICIIWKKKVCTESWPSPVMGDIYFAVAHLTLCFVFPLAVIGACYALVCRRIWCRKIPGNELAQQPESQHTNSQQSSEQQQTHPGNHKVTVRTYKSLVFIIL